MKLKLCLKKKKKIEVKIDKRISIFAKMVEE